jgi:predicted transcriptional regulator
MSNRKRGEAHAERVTMLAEMPDGFSIWEFADHFGLKYQQARHTINAMEHSGLITKTGPHSGRIFRKVVSVDTRTLDIPYFNPSATSTPTGLAGLFFRYS